MKAAVDDPAGPGLPQAPPLPGVLRHSLRRLRVPAQLDCADPGGHDQCGQEKYFPGCDRSHKGFVRRFDDRSMTLPN
jgi:hypothetical protein